MAGIEGALGREVSGRTFGLKPGEEGKAFQTQETYVREAPVSMQLEQVRVSERKCGGARRADCPAELHQLTQVSPGPRRCGVRGPSSGKRV